ncbi:MAG: hypothetical protein P8Y01_00400 [Woeseiaceae bacterium]|jgi:hypothetical protein
MNATDLLRAIVAPLTELTILLPLLLFWAAIAFGLSGGVLGIVVIILSLPPLFRFQSHILDAYANGRAPEAFDAEYFNWVGSLWTLFPLLLFAACGIAGFAAFQAGGTTGLAGLVLVAALLTPASLAVLTITRSPLQALNPAALWRVYERVGPAFLIAPAYLLAATGFLGWYGDLPPWARPPGVLFLLYSLAALIGTLIAPRQLVHDVYIPDGREPDAKQIAADVNSARALALTHAYGFISRDNRRGGFEHLFAAIERDPDPAGAWAWYFDRMLGWENPLHALFFAQHYVHDALAHGEDLKALKVILRCRLVNEQFKPFADDLRAAQQAAERSHNAELAEVLKQG